MAIRLIVWLVTHENKYFEELKYFIMINLMVGPIFIGVKFVKDPYKEGTFIFERIGFLITVHGYYSVTDFSWGWV